MVVVDIMRHGESLANVAMRNGTITGILQGITMIDPPLSPNGIIKCQSLKKKLKIPDVVFVSPLRRSIQTANIIYPTKRAFFGFYLLELGPGNQNKPNGKKSFEKGNLKKFMLWLQKYLQQRPEITYVVVITHSLLMRRDLRLSTKPENNAMFRIHI